MLNNWSGMNFSLTKSITSEKILAEMSSDLYTRLGCSKKDILPKEVAGSIHIGYWPSVAKHLQNLLSTNPRKYGDLSPDSSSFEWLANVHEIFNATLMNMELKITSYNIDK